MGPAVVAIGNLCLPIILCTTLASTDLAAEHKWQILQVARSNRVTQFVELLRLQPVLNLMHGSILVCQERKEEGERVTEIHKTMRRHCRTLTNTRLRHLFALIVTFNVNRSFRILVFVFYKNLATNIVPRT